MKNSASRQSGFTIVETIIVLAIGGLILLLVFEAIPTLQRNSRNGNRKQDVTAILQALSHYELNNSANFPSSVGSFLTATNPRLYYYQTSQVNLHSETAGGAPGAISASTNLNAVDIYNYERCSGTAASNRGAGYNDTVALFAIEVGSGAAGQCLEI